jgi:prolipoprotein diacylglyceryltransferase
MTLPIYFYIGDYQVSLPVAGIVLFAISFCFCFWVLSRRKLRSVLSFDVVIITLLMILLISRILAVINNLDQYLADITGVLDLFDKNFLMSGLVLTIVISSLLLYRSKPKELNFYTLLERLLISFAGSSVFLYAGLFLGGKLLGTVNNGGLSFPYEDGTRRLPIAIFGMLYNLLFLGFWLLMRKAKFKQGIFPAIFLMGYASIEFISRFFSNGYNPAILGIFDLSQLIYLLLLVIGIMILGNAYNINVITMPEKETAQEPVRKKFDIAYRSEPVSTRDRFSLSYSDIESSTNSEDLTLKERFRSLNNTVKRKFRK